ncbi:hypothetical protein HDU96_010761 [Phlyctochytrium bullatum]|nr:hypothetical protein HDU96_010761 [Phlyctochytrium bullatum]
MLNGRPPQDSNPTGNGGAGTPPRIDLATALRECVRLGNALRAAEAKRIAMENKILTLQDEVSVLRSILAQHNIRQPASVLSTHGPRPLPAAYMHPPTAAQAPSGSPPGLQNFAPNPLSTGTYASRGPVAVMPGPWLGPTRNTMAPMYALGSELPWTQGHASPAGPSNFPAIRPSPPIPAPNALTNPSKIAAMSGGQHQDDDTTKVLQRPTGGKDNRVSKTRKKKKAAPSPSELQAPAPAPAPAPAAEAGTSTATLNLASVTLGFSAQQLERAVAGGRVIEQSGKKGQMQLVFWYDLVQGWFPNLLEEASQDDRLRNKLLAAIRNFIETNSKLAGFKPADCLGLRHLGPGLKRKKLHVVPLSIADQFQGWFLNFARETLGMLPVMHNGPSGGGTAQVAGPGPVDGQAGPSEDGAAERTGPPPFVIVNGVRLVHYPHILRMMMRDFPNLPQDTQDAVMRGVRDFLFESGNSLSACVIPTLDQGGNFTFGIPEHLIRQFLVWAYRELRRCFPDSEILLPDQREIFRPPNDIFTAPALEGPMVTLSVEQVEGVAPAASAVAPENASQPVLPTTPPRNTPGDGM